MTLNDDLSRAATNYLETVVIQEAGGSLVTQPALRALYDLFIIDDALVDGALEKAVIKQARRDFGRLINPRITLSNNVYQMESPQCIAYALAMGEFSEDEIDQINFDYGETAQTFTNKYPNGQYSPHLIDILKRKLIFSEPATP